MRNTHINLPLCKSSCILQQLAHRTTSFFEENIQKIISIVLLLVSLAITNPLHAQTTNISGVVKSENSSESLIGATVQTSQQATLTDFEGIFQLENVPLNDTLKISYVGYDDLVIPLAQLTNLEPLILRLPESENILQTATVTSGKFDKALGEITVSMEVLKPKLLEDVNTASLDQVLEKVPGVTIIDGQANIRGGSGFSYGAGSRVLLLVDDIPALQADAGFPNWDDLPIELTNQIEVLKGASSALFGSSAMNGIINLRTDFAKEQPETKIASYYSIYQAPSDRAKQWWVEDRDTIPHDFVTYITHKQKLGRVDLVGSVFVRNNQEWNKNSFKVYQRGALGVRYRIDKNWTLAVNGSIRDGKNSSFFFWQNADSLALVGSPGAFANSNATRIYLDPSLQYLDNNGNRHRLQARIYDVNNQVENNQSSSSTLYYGEYQYQKRFAAKDLVLTGGLVVSSTDSEAELYSNSNFTSNNLAAYAQADKKFFDKLNVSLGLRYEQNRINAPDSIPINNVNMAAGSEQESKPVFRIGANYQAGKFTFLRASFGQGYRFPTIAEKFINVQVGFNISPNLDLRSESGWSVEIGIKQGIKINEFKGLVDFAIFQTEYEDMMDFTFSNVLAIGFQSQNVGNTIIRGLDFNIAGQGKILPSLPISVLLGYTYIDPKFKDFGEFEMNTSSSERNILKYRFQHTAKLDIATNYDKFNIGVAGFYYSEMEAIDRLLEFFIPGLMDYRAENNKPITIWNFRASYLVNEQLKCSLIWRNALNKEYSIRPGTLEAPSNIAFRVDYTFQKPRN